MKIAKKYLFCRKNSNFVTKYYPIILFVISYYPLFSTLRNTLDILKNADIVNCMESETIHKGNFFFSGDLSQNTLRPANEMK